MVSEGNALVASVVTGSVGLIAQVTAPMETSFERLGVATVLVIAAGFALRYLVNELAKKDARIEAMQAAHLRSVEMQTDKVVAHLEDAAEQRLALTSAITAQTTEIRELRNDLK